MRQRGVRRVTAAVGAMVALSLVMTSCRGDDDADRPPNPGQATSVTVDIDQTNSTTASFGGVEVAVPAGGFTKPGSLTLSAGDTPPAAALTATGLRGGGASVHVDVLDTALVGRASVRVAVPDAWPHSWVPVMAWEDNAGGWRWLPTKVSKDANGHRVAVARTGHFSSGFLGAFDPRTAAKAAAGELKNLIVGRAGVSSPHCEGEATARESLTVRSDSGDAVKWCVGMQDGRPVLKVTNNRRIFAQLAVPLSSRVISGDGWGISVGNLVRLVGQGMETFAAGFPSDRRILLLGSGKTVTIALPAGLVGGAQITASVSAYLFSILIDAVDMLVTISGAAGLKATTKGEAVFNLLGSGSGSRSEWAQTTFACVREMSSLFTDDLSTPAAGAEDLAKVLRFAGRCGAEIGKASIDDSGVLGWLVSATVATVVGIVELVYSLIEEFFAGIREIIDNVGSLFGSANDPEYDVVTYPKVDTSLLGTKWYVHGGQLTIRENRTAQSVGHGICLDKWGGIDTYDWCNDIIDFTVTPTAHGVTLTVIRSYVRDEQTKQKGVDRRYAVPVGTTFTLERYLDDYLMTQRYSPAGRHLYPDSANSVGNPYLCAPHSSDPERLCGA